MSTTLDFMFAVFGLVFTFWPVFLTSALKGRGNLLRNLLFTWSFWAIIRVFLFFGPEPLQTSFLISEPLNTVLFFACGLVLLGIWYGQKLWQRGRLLRKAGDVHTAKDLLELSPREFEDMAVELFLAYGHKAKRTGKAGDHGVDVVVQTKKGEKCVVQCKRWKGRVGEPVVRDFYGVVMHEKADKGVVITSGTFSRPAQEWVKGKPIALYDGDKFVQLWRRTRAKQERAQLTPSSSDQPVD